MSDVETEVQETHWRVVLKKIAAEDKVELKTEKFPKWFRNALRDRILAAHSEENVCGMEDCTISRASGKRGISDPLIDKWALDVFVEVYSLVSYRSFPLELLSTTHRFLCLVLPLAGGPAQIESRAS